MESYIISLLYLHLILTEKNFFYKKGNKHLNIFWVSAVCLYHAIFGVDFKMLDYANYISITGAQHINI